MPLARRLLRVGQGYQPGGSWQWHGSMLDNMGGAMVANFDGTNWFTGSDIGGMHKLQGGIPGGGIMTQYDAGRANTASNLLNPDYHKVSAVRSDGTTVYSLGGDGTAGAIHSRQIGTDTQWTLRSSDFYGDVSVAIGQGRPVGNRRICIDSSTNCVYVACQSLTSSKNGGIAISKNGGAFTKFHTASTFTVGRMFRAIQATVHWSDVIYASADNDTGTNAAAGNAPGVFVYTGASTASPTVCRIDTTALGGPNLVDWKDMMVISENGKDALYIASGYQDGAAGAGIWRCTINTSPSGWGGSPSASDITWVHVLVAGSAIDYRGIYAYRNPGDTATYAIATTYPPQTGSGAVKPPSLTGTIPGTTTSYIRTIVRSLDAHTANPTWSAVTDAVNISPAGSLLPIYGTGETWLQATGSMNSATNSNGFLKTVLGGPNHGVFDIDVDPVNQHAIISGKQGSWIGFNIWSPTLANITWQPIPTEQGNCTNHGVEVHPTNNLAVAHSDTDRTFYFYLEGGAGQARGCAARFNNPPVGQSVYIRQGATNQGRLLVGTDASNVSVSDDWSSVPDRNTAPTLATDTVTSAGTTLDKNNNPVPASIVAIGEWTVGGNTYRLAFSEAGIWSVKVNTGAWNAFGSTVSGITASTHGEYRVIANDGHIDCWVMVSSKGLFYCPDITAVSPTITNIWPENVGNQIMEGSVAQDPVTRTTLYVTWGKGFNGVWKITRADASTFVSSGSSVTVTGPGSATNIASGSLATTKPYGPIDVDSDGSIIVCEPGYTGRADIHYASDGQTFVSVGDQTFAEACQTPNSVRKRGDHIYVGSWTSGCIYAQLV